MALDLSKLQGTLEQQAPDLTKPTQGGGDFAPPAAGACRLRFVGYVEIGNHESTFQGVKKDKPRCIFVFEVSGPKHQPVEADGKKIPHLVTLRDTVGTNEKSNYIKLFKLMNCYEPKSNFVGLLGNAYRATIVHEPKDAKNPNPNEVYVRLKTDAGYTILPTTYENPETGEPMQVKVAEPLTPVRVLIWDHADVEQWDTLFMDGKNWMQETVRKALNFKGSPIYNALQVAGRTADLVAPVNQRNEPAPAPAADPAPAAPKAGPSVTQAPAKADPADDDIPW
jgi:hypothetical protein